MRAGALRHRVTFQAPTRGQSGTGAPTTTYVTVATAWASVEPIKGREFLAGQTVQSETTDRVRCRYRAGLNTATRITYGNRTLDIVALIDIGERHRELEIMCKEVT